MNTNISIEILKFPKNSLKHGIPILLPKMPENSPVSGNFRKCESPDC